MVSRFAYTSANKAIKPCDPVQVAGYLGKSDAFDCAIASFAARYARTNERDHTALRIAIEAGRVEAADH